MDNFFTRAASVIRNEHRPPRLYHLYNLILMFFIFSFTGWVWEVIYIGFTEGVVAKRGMLHGPWLPIYGVGGVLILLLLSRFRNNPPLVFLLAVLLCGTIEYNTAVMIEMIFRCRWWDYSTKFMNLNGRICLEGLMMFGVTGTLATLQGGSQARQCAVENTAEAAHLSEHPPQYLLCRGYDILNVHSEYRRGHYI